MTNINEEEMVERVARVLCAADGKNPDAQQCYPVKVYTDGKRTDTGHDSRISHIEDVRAPPQWCDYAGKARAAIAAMPSSSEADRLRSILRLCRPGTDAVDLGNGEIIALCLRPAPPKA